MQIHEKHLYHDLWQYALQQKDTSQIPQETATQDTYAAKFDGI